LLTIARVTQIPKPNPKSQIRHRTIRLWLTNPKAPILKARRRLPFLIWSFEICLALGSLEAWDFGIYEFIEFVPQLSTLTDILEIPIRDPFLELHLGSHRALSFARVTVRLSRLRSSTGTDCIRSALRPDPNDLFRNCRRADKILRHFRWFGNSAAGRVCARTASKRTNTDIPTTIRRIQFHLDACNSSIIGGCDSQRKAKI